METHIVESEVMAAAQVCNACGLPPRTCDDGVSVTPLKSCSRCKKVWYHDVSCQKKDYKRHRKVCQQATIQEENLEEEQQPLLYRVERSKGAKGNYLVATEDLDKGCFFHPLGFAPLVPPVLIESMRSQRCTVCFGRLEGEALRFDESPASDLYPVLLCSDECLVSSSSWLKKEEQLVSKVCKLAGRPIRIFPTAIALYRIATAIATQPQARERWVELQQHTPRISDDKGEEAHHLRAITTIAIHLLRESGQGEEYTLEDLTSMVTRLKTNGFSIADGESVAIGIGLYATASFANHSCSPNTLQTFNYGQKGRIPSLRLTTCEHIDADQEICISYVDNLSPHVIRQNLLQESYYFNCTCERCLEEEKNTSTSNEMPLCVSCHSTVCDNGESCNDCNLQLLIDEIGSCDSEPDRLKLCHEALALAEEMVKGRSTEQPAWQALRTSLLKFKCAKLRLFVQPDPRAAIGQLQECLQELLIFYPPNHELVRNVKDSLRQGYM